MLSNSCSRRSRPPRRAGRPLLLGCLLAGLLACGLCSAASWRDELHPPLALGDGEMRWLGLRIYHATLWAEQQPFQPERAFALQLRYERSISRERLVQASLSEMRRLGGGAVDDATLARWRLALLGAFTDVAPGDELIGVYLPGHGARFYNQQRLLADIDDPRLAHAFFAIWLDPATREPDLRGQMMGAAP